MCGTSPQLLADFMWSFSSGYVTITNIKILAMVQDESIAGGVRESDLKTLFVSVVGPSSFGSMLYVVVPANKIFCFILFFYS